MTIGQTVEKKIKESGKTIREVALKARINPQTIYNWVYGLSDPSVYCLIPIADVLGVSLDELVGRKAPSPCNQCRFYPPSSCDGKPCAICPAQAKE
jgi:transcriptional regulator with XRE-family HTH domain